MYQRLHCAPCCAAGGTAGRDLTAAAQHPEPARRRRVPTESSADDQLLAGRRDRPAARCHRTVPRLQPRALRAGAGLHRRTLGNPGHPIGNLDQRIKPVPGHHRRPARGHRTGSDRLLPIRLGADHPRVRTHPSAHHRRASTSSPPTPTNDSPGCWSSPPSPSASPGWPWNTPSAPCSPNRWPQPSSSPSTD